MMIHLSNDHEQFVHSLAEGGRFASEDAAVEEAIRLLAAQYGKHENEQKPQNEAETTAWQLGNLRRVCEKLDAMPTAKS